MKTKLIELGCVVVGILLLVLVLTGVFGCREKIEASESTTELARPIYLNTTGAIWIFEGTFCSECNKLYNYIEHPKTCDICNAQTKDFYYLCLIKDRKQ